MVQRTRSAPPTASAETGVASLPSELPPLSVLVEQVRAPGAARAEVDTLLAGLSQPLPPEDSPRERADLLLSLIEDARIADYTGSGGRTVRSTAIEALVALGYPYALEVPPEALGAEDREEEHPQDWRPGRKGKRGFQLIALSGALQALLVLAFTAGIWTRVGQELAVGIVFIASSTVLPAWLLMLGRMMDSYALMAAGLIGLVLSSLVWLLLCVFSLAALPYGLIPLILGGFVITGTVLMALWD